MDAAMGVKLSVIVPAYNAAGTLPACLHALLHQTIARDEYEIIVVDDGSTDGTGETVPQSEVVLIRQTHRGPAAARNGGIRVARGELLLFTDADCVPTPNWIEAMAGPFKDSQVAGCKGVYRTHQRNLLARFVQVEYEEKYRAMEGTSSIDFVDTYSAAYRKEVLVDEGCFSEEILAAEDAELSFRLTERGYRLIFNPQGVVYHHHARPIWRYLRRKFSYGEWRLQVYARFPQKIKGDSHTPASLRWELMLTALMLLTFPFCPFHPVARWLLLSLAAAFLLVTAPFTGHAWSRDRTVACISPVMLWVRSLALGAGMCWGFSLLLKNYLSRMLSSRHDASSIF